MFTCVYVCVCVCVCVCACMCVHTHAHITWTSPSFVPFIIHNQRFNLITIIHAITRIDPDVNYLAGLLEYNMVLSNKVGVVLFCRVKYVT